MSMGGAEFQRDLVALIRSSTGLLQLAAYIRDTRRTDPTVEHAYPLIDFTIDSRDEPLSPGAFTVGHECKWSGSTKTLSET